MRRRLGPLLAGFALAAPLLAGCGSSTTTAHDSSGSAAPPGPSSSSASGAVDYRVVKLLSQTAAGGTVSSTLTPLADAGDVKAFGRQFRMPAMAGRIAAVMRSADLPSDRLLMGAVVSVGCDVPPGVDVFRQGGELSITAQEVPSPLPECLAPVTTVALVSLPAPS
jgi:hypothetical protein